MTLENVEECELNADDENEDDSVELTTFSVVIDWPIDVVILLFATVSYGEILFVSVPISLVLDFKLVDVMISSIELLVLIEVSMEVDDCSGDKLEVSVEMLELSNSGR